MVRSCVIILAVFGSSLAVAPTLVQAQTRDFTYESRIANAQAEPGQTYSLYVTFHNHSNRTILFETFIDSLPNGDRMLSPSVQERHVGAGGSYTFRFDIYCGVRGGTVNWSYAATFAR